MNWTAMVHSNLPGNVDAKWNCIRLLLASLRTPSVQAQAPCDSESLTEGNLTCLHLPLRWVLRWRPRCRPRWRLTHHTVRVADITFYTVNDAGLSDDEWEIIKARHLLTDSEAKRINSYPGYMPLLPLTWAAVEVESAVLGTSFNDLPTRALENGGRIEDIQRYRVGDLLKLFNHIIFEFRGHCGFITNWIAMPEPFPYYHAVTFGTYMYGGSPRP